jgi:hypothetical protein
MARSVDDIKLQMDTQQAAESGLSSLNNPSQTSIYQLFKDVVSFCINYFEQLVDTKKDETDAIVALAAPSTPTWVQAKVLEFQYSATNPQILSLVDYVPTYATTDTSLRIISRCAVITNNNRTAKIKVATGTTPVQLSGVQFSALDAYIDVILPVGLKYELINLASDKLYFEGEVYYDGQYINSIQDNVEAAINTYLSNLPFNGAVYVSSLEDVIQSVDGVSDVKILNIKARQDATVFASASTVYNLSTGLNSRKWDTVAGYIVEETTGGETFADKITYIVN